MSLGSLLVLDGLIQIFLNEFIIPKPCRVPSYLQPELPFKMKTPIFTTLAYLAASLLMFSATARNERNPNGLVKRANVTDTEVLEDIAEARTCEDCQVCYLGDSFCFGQVISPEADKQPPERDGRPPGSRQ